MTVGLDHFRTAMLLAVVEKKLGYSFAGEDIYLNVAGGMSIEEPAADLGVGLAVGLFASRTCPCRRSMAVFGEVGLSGEIRSVAQALARIKEAQSLGFETVILPPGNLAGLEKEGCRRSRAWACGTVREALQLRILTAL